MLYVNPVSFPTTFMDKVFNESKRREIAGMEMERLFVYELLKEMKKTIPESKLFPKSLAKEVYYEMLYDALAGEIARSKQLGIAEQIVPEQITNETSMEI